MSTTLKKKVGVLPWLITTGMPSVRRCTKGIEGEDWGDVYEAYKEMSRAVEVKKPQETQKAKALAKEAGEVYYDPTREDIRKGRSRHKISIFGRAPQRSNCCVGQCPEVRGRSVLEVSARVLWGRCFLQWLLLASSEVCGKSRFGRAFGLTWFRWIVCVCAYAQHTWSGMC